MTVSFSEKLQSTQARSRFALYITPKLATLPPEIQRYDDPFLPYMRAIFTATHDLVCAYAFNFPAYLALGAAGAVALERSIGLVTGSHITILDGRFSSEEYVALWDEAAFCVDGLTITTDAQLAAFETRADRQAFVVTELDAFHKARFSVVAGEFVLHANRIDLLPADTLARVRSLTFEKSLREMVESYIRA